MRASTLAACLLLSTQAWPTGAVFTGYARDLQTNSPLYVEVHSVADPGTAREMRVVMYRCVEGPAFARKELAYDADRTAPSFRFEDSRSGHDEGLVRHADRIEVFERSGARAARRTAQVDPDGLVADAGFDEFVRLRWDALERGETLDAPFLVPSRLGRMTFRIRKIGEARIGAEQASVIRLSLAGLLRVLVPDIDVTYRQRDRVLVRYRGLTNVRDAGGRMLEAQIDFPDDGRYEVAVDLAALRAQPLVARCGPRRMGDGKRGRSRFPAPNHTPPSTDPSADPRRAASLPSSASSRARRQRT
jgi:hypothetical protein